MDNTTVNVKNKPKKEKFSLVVSKKLKKSCGVVNVEKNVHILLKTNNLS